MSRSIQDALLTSEKALPAAASTAITSSDFDLGEKPGDLEAYELAIVIPALNTTMLPDTKTLSVAIQSGAAAAPTTTLVALPDIVGAGGAGYAGGTIKCRLPSNTGRYVNVKLTTGATTTTMAAVKATFKLLF